MLGGKAWTWLVYAPTTVREGASRAIVGTAKQRGARWRSRRQLPATPDCAADGASRRVPAAACAVLQVASILFCIVSLVCFGDLAQARSIRRACSGWRLPARVCERRSASLYRAAAAACRCKMSRRRATWGARWVTAAVSLQMRCRRNTRPCPPGLLAWRRHEPQCAAALITAAAPPLLPPCSSTARWQQPSWLRC